MKLNVFRRCSQLAFSLTFLLTTFNASSAQAPISQKPGSKSQLLILAHKGADQAEVNDALKQVDGDLIKTMTNGRLTLLLVEVPNSSSQKSFEKLTKNKMLFDAVQHNRAVKLAGISQPINDPIFPQQYALAQLNVPRGLAMKADGRGVVVGVIDSGVVPQNDLAPRVTRGLNTLTGGAGNNDPTAGFKHGTMVSTCLAATTNNHLFGASAANRATIIPVDVINGTDTTTDADIASAIFYLESHHVRLINMSLQDEVPNTFANRNARPVLFQLFVDFYNSGGLFFNAAGNDGKFDSSPRTPYLIVVSAINENEEMAYFSTHGNPLWFTAAGQFITSSNADNQVATASGTSFAGPYACSVAASIWSRYPYLSNADVLNLMMKTAVKPPNYDPLKFGYGIPNLGAAVGNP